MKRKLLLVLLFGLFALQASSHEYFFGFAEMEYKEAERKIELTIILSSHDIQSVWLNDNTISKGFYGLQNTAQSIHEELERMQDALNKDFVITNNGKTIPLILQGFDMTENGMVQFYLSAENVELSPAFDLRFSTLMKEFPQQQNKITYRNNGVKQTAVFLQHQQTQKLNK